MKKLPLILLLVGILVFTGVYFLVLRKPAEEVGEEEEQLLQVSLIDRPVTSLTPSEDGHWLKLRIEKFLAGAKSLDYELLYTLPDGRTQGVPGTITLKGESFIERDLLLGSESSGKFRYDEGVETGTLSLRFRNDKGKLMAKFTTKFHLESGEKELTSVDEALSFTLKKIPSKTFFVTMETFGVAEIPPGDLSAGPYGIFGSGASAYPGSVKLNAGAIYILEGSSWTKLEGGEANDIGTFVAISE